jgi:hypothetical protein
MPMHLTTADRRRVLDVIEAFNGDAYNQAKELAEDLPDRLLDHTIYSAGENMPGYMPDSPYLLFFSERAARGHCRALESGGRDYVSDYMPITLREMLL